MTREERKVRDFSAGMKNLSPGGQDYITELTGALLVIENSLVQPTPDTPNRELSPAIGLGQLPVPWEKRPIPRGR